MLGIGNLQQINIIINLLKFEKQVFVIMCVSLYVTF